MQVDHGKNIIEVENVSFSYGTGENVLENVTLSIHQGDYIGLIGPNGAGKTTLLKVMLGLLVPQVGQVRLFGQDLATFRDRRKIGYVPQKVASFDMNFPVTVRDVVLMGRSARRGLFARVTTEDRQRVEEALALVDMREYGDRLIGDLSGGQQQRVFIARALVSQPEVIFLDEPTTGIDTRVQDEFYALLQKLNRDLHITLVIVSHDVDRIAKEVMHVVCVDRTLTCHATPQDYFQAHRQPQWEDEWEKTREALTYKSRTS